MPLVATRAWYSQRLPGPHERASIRTLKRHLAGGRPRRSSPFTAQEVDPTLLVLETRVSGQQALGLYAAAQFSHVNEQDRLVASERTSQALPQWHAILQLWRASSLTWRSAFLFFTGSVLFTLSCSLGLFQTVVSQSLCNMILVVYPYAAGSVFYTWGAYYTMLASAAEHKRLKHRKQQSGQSRSGLS